MHFCTLLDSEGGVLEQIGVHKHVVSILASYVTRYGFT